MSRRSVCRRLRLSSIERIVASARVVVDHLVRATELEHAAFLAQVAGGGVFDVVENHPADLGAQHVVVAPV
jgi:preprotein translocase subunit SecB